MPLRLSVVIIVYNLERFVRQAIESVVQQTRPADEIIVIDDCSTDGSANIIAEYSNRLRYHRMPTNSGAFLATLEGVKRASGDVVAMLDGDDEWALNKLEVVEQRFVAEPELMLLSHPHIRVSEAGVKLSGDDETHRNIRRILTVTNNCRGRSDLFRQSILEQRGFWMGSAYSFRRSSFQLEQFVKVFAKVDSAKLRLTYLDLVIAPFLVLSQPKLLIGHAEETFFMYRIHSGGSLSGNATVVGALKSLERGRAVNELIYLLLKAYGATQEQMNRRRRLIAYYDYMAHLYAGEKFRALSQFFVLAWYDWALRQTLSEGIRLALCLIFGPKRFLRLKQTRTFELLAPKR